MINTTAGSRIDTRTIDNRDVVAWCRSARTMRRVIATEVVDGNEVVTTAATPILVTSAVLAALRSWPGPQVVEVVDNGVLMAESRDSNGDLVDAVYLSDVDNGPSSDPLPQPTPRAVDIEAIREQCKRGLQAESDAITYRAYPVEVRTELLALWNEAIALGYRDRIRYIAQAVGWIRLVEQSIVPTIQSIDEAQTIADVLAVRLPPPPPDPLVTKVAANAITT